jgi:hypothetical protein
MNVWQFMVKEQTNPIVVLAETLELAVEKFRANEAKTPETPRMTIASVSRLCGVDLQ